MVDVHAIIDGCILTCIVSNSTAISVYVYPQLNSSSGVVLFGNSSGGVWASAEVWLLRDAFKSDDEAGLKTRDAGDADATVTAKAGGSPALWQLRGLQSTAAFFPSMFRTWAEFRRYVQAQAAFGTNQIEMGGAPVCDANGSIAHTRLVNATLCEASVEGIVNFSRELHQIGMNVSFGQSLAVFTEHKSLMERAWRLMPRVDSIFWPGGDGGSLVWSSVELAATTLRKYHPAAQIWVSAQEYNETQLEQFIHRLEQPATRRFLSGVVIGPHWRIPTTEIVRRVPKGYLLRQYPDICHSLESQYAIPDWHWAWQFTHGREAINPMPMMTDRIVRLRGNGSAPTFGVGAYSEGVSDDLNRALWSAIAQNPKDNVSEIVFRYARYHFAPAAAPSMARALFGLEQNWFGDIATNQNIATTLQDLQTAERLTPPSQRSTNWRLQMYLYRGYYDAFIQVRFHHEQQCERNALSALSRATITGPKRAITSALAHICCIKLVPGCSNRTGSIPLCELPEAARTWRARLFELHTMIDSSVGVNVVQRQTKDLNLVQGATNINVPLSDAAFLSFTLGNILAVKSKARQLQHINALLARTDPGPGGFYQGFGPFGHSHSNGTSSHLVAGPGPSADPAYFFSPLTSAWVSRHSHGHPVCAKKLAWTRSANSFYDQPLQLQFDGLDAQASYGLQIVYFTTGPDPAGCTNTSCPCIESNICRAPVRLMANGELVHGYQAPPLPMQALSFSLPQNTTKGGTLQLSCNQRPGQGGDGRTCCVSEVWLRKSTRLKSDEC